MAEEAYFEVDESPKKFYAVYVASIIKLHPCFKFDENWPRDVKVKIWGWLRTSYIYIYIWKRENLLRK